jgi:AbrB family looped-hinge helix DNA binding protein
MNYQVTVTSQGQITIPAPFRKKLNLTNKKLIMSMNGDSLILEPAPDILTSFGVLNDNALKNKTLDEIIELENIVLTDAVASKYSPNKASKSI